MDSTTKVNPRQFSRFFSAPHSNYAHMEEDDETKTTNKSSRSVLKNLEKDLRRQVTKAERKIDQLEKEAQIIGDLSQKPEFTRVISIVEEKEVDQQTNIIVESVIPATAIDLGVTHPQNKTTSQRLRWNLLFNLLLWLVVPFPFWIPFVSNHLAIYLLPSIQTLFVFMWIVIALLGLKNALVLYHHRSSDYDRKIASLEQKRIRHIVIINCYKEPIELIATSIQTVADQTEVKRVTMVIGFEERTPDKEEKCRYLEDRFKDAGFERLIFPIHPYGLPHEIPGKCSNSNYSLRTAANQMNISKDQNEEEEEEMKHILVTTCDADSKFPSTYIAALTYKYLQENQPALSAIYQAPLFYNWKLDGLSFVTRVTGLLRSLLMLGALIPFNINTMSIFSYSLLLAKKGNFIHPGYQMDDIICLIRWMGVTQRRLRISMIPVPVISGPTSGETVEIECMEWARQIRRWTIGAAEVFHYFIIKAKRMPTIAAISWGFVFITYYGILLCTGGLFGLTSMLSMFLLVKDVPPMIGYFMHGLLVAQMLTFLMAFVIDGFIGRLIKVNECIFILRNAFHFISTPFVLLAYSFVELYALHEVVIFGKKVCKHGASAKSALN